jgi:hypothetical protein
MQGVYLELWRQALFSALPGICGRSSLEISNTRLPIRIGFSMAHDVALRVRGVLIQWKSELERFTAFNCFAAF